MAQMEDMNDYFPLASRNTLTATSTFAHCVGGERALVPVTTRSDGTTRFVLYNLLTRYASVAKDPSGTSTDFVLPASSSVTCSFEDGKGTVFLCIWDEAARRASIFAFDAASASTFTAVVGKNTSRKIVAGAEIRSQQTGSADFAVFLLSVSNTETELSYLRLSNFAVERTTTLTAQTFNYTQLVASETAICALATQSPGNNALQCFDTNTLAATSSSTSLASYATADLLQLNSGLSRLLIHVRSVPGGPSSILSWRISSSTATPQQIQSPLSLPPTTTTTTTADVFGYDRRSGRYFVVMLDAANKKSYVTVFEAHWARAQISILGDASGYVLMGYDLAKVTAGSTLFLAVCPVATGSERDGGVNVLTGDAWRYYVEPLARSLMSRTATHVPPPPPTTAGATTLSPADAMAAANTPASTNKINQIGLDNSTRNALFTVTYLAASLPTLYFAPTLGLTVMRGVRLDTVLCRGGISAEAPIEFFPAHVVPPFGVGAAPKGEKTRGAIVLYMALAFGVALFAAVLRSFWSKETGREYWTPPPMTAQQRQQQQEREREEAERRKRQQEQEEQEQMQQAAAAASSSTARHGKPGKRDKRDKKHKRDKHSSSSDNRQERELERALDRNPVAAQAREQQRVQPRQQALQQREQSKMRYPEKPQPIFSYVGLALMQFLVPWAMSAGYLFGLPELTGQALAVMPFVAILLFFIIVLYKLSQNTVTPSPRSLRVAPLIVVRDTPIELATPDVLKAERTLRGTFGQVALLGEYCWEVPVAASIEVVEFWNNAKLIFRCFWGPMETCPAILSTQGGAEITDSVQRIASRHYIAIASTFAVAIGIIQGHSAVDRVFCPYGRIVIAVLNALSALIFWVLRSCLIPMHNWTIGAMEVTAAIMSFVMAAGFPDIDWNDISDANSSAIAIMEVISCVVGILCGVIVLVCGALSIWYVRKANATILNPTKRHMQVSRLNLLSFLGSDFGMTQEMNEEPLLPLHPPNQQQQQPRRPPNLNDDDDDDDDDAYYDDLRGGTSSSPRGTSHHHRGGSDHSMIPMARDDTMEFVAAPTQQYQPQRQQRQAVVEFARPVESQQYQRFKNNLPHIVTNDSLATAATPAAESLASGARTPQQQQPQQQSHQQHQPAAAAAVNTKQPNNSSTGTSNNINISHVNSSFYTTPNSGSLTPKQVRFQEYLERKAQETPHDPKWVRRNSRFVQDADPEHLDKQLDDVFKPRHGESPNANKYKHLQRAEKPADLKELEHDLEDMLDPEREVPTTVRKVSQLDDKIGALLTPEQMAAHAERQQRQQQQQQQQQQSDGIPEMRKQIIRLRAFYNFYNPAKSDLEIEQAVIAWTGRWPEMWDALTGLFGPEPGSPRPPQTTQWQMKPAIVANHDLLLDDSPSPARQQQQQQQQTPKQQAEQQREKTPVMQQVKNNIDDDHHHHGEAVDDNSSPALVIALRAERVENRDLRNRLERLEQEMMRLKSSPVAAAKTAATAEPAFAYPGEMRSSSSTMMMMVAAERPATPAVRGSSIMTTARSVSGGGGDPFNNSGGGNNNGGSPVPFTAGKQPHQQPSTTNINLGTHQQQRQQQQQEHVVDSRGVSPEFENDGGSGKDMSYDEVLAYLDSGVGSQNGGGRGGGGSGVYTLDDDDDGGAPEEFLPAAKSKPTWSLL